MLEDVGLHLDPDQLVGDVPPAQRALIAFVRATRDVWHERGESGGLLVLDEPTAYLPAASVDKIFAGTRALVEAGAAALFVSHRLDEVLRFADVISVIREGRMVATLGRDEATEPDLIRLILGRELGSLSTAQPPAG